MEVALYEPGRSTGFSSFSGLKPARLSKVKLGFRPRYSGPRVFRCRGASDVASAMAMDWRPALDEVVLMSSILLAYVAGIGNKPFNSSLSGLRTLNPASTNKTFTEKSDQRTEAQSIECIWDRLDGKLTGAATRFESTIESSPALYLQALDQGPRIRLLLAASKLLRNESSNQLPSPISLDDLCSMAGKLCRSWVTEESSRAISIPARFLATTMANVELEALTGSVEIEARAYTLNSLQRSGKIELYIDLLTFLNKLPATRATISEAADAKLAQNVLEDILIVVSEGAAAMYLNAVAGMRAGWPPLLHPSISSTRALERFRNKIALQQWIHHNLDSVAAIYEDRVELLVISASEAEPTRLSQLSIRVRRSRELRELSGWRFFYSLCLEFYDVVGPVARMLIAKVGQGLSFLLVCLIGRSFGLIYQGIRQSVKWSSD